MITDAKIRAELKHVYKETTYNGEPLARLRLVDELAIPKQICLADVVAIPVEEESYNGFHGFEIKSEVDSLTRLESQVHYYSKVFRKCTLIVTEKHEEKAMDMIPDWWGVILAHPLFIDEYGEPSESFALIEVREAKENPSPLEAYGLTQLLWRNELLSIVKEKEIKIAKSSSKRLLRGAIVKAIDVRELEQIVIGYLARREDWKVPGEKYKRPKRASSKRQKRTRISYSKK
ncbi:sce7726 family protein [Rossellomorea marisflavi]|uniref:sce7726 family protein n=1 Tax=Rossellomorea marisflavi TaxID=189381 RepID=UPI003FA104E1